MKRPHGCRFSAQRDGLAVHTEHAAERALVAVHAPGARTLLLVDLSGPLAEPPPAVELALPFAIDRAVVLPRGGGGGGGGGGGARFAAVLHASAASSAEGADATVGGEAEERRPFVLLVGDGAAHLRPVASLPPALRQSDTAEAEAEAPKLSAELHLVHTNQLVQA